MENIDVALKTALKDDTIFNKINSQFLQLDSDDIKTHNQDLKIIEELIKIMEEVNPLFSKIYQKIIWAGSYYKKTRIGRPEEYDINLVINLPIKERDLKFIADYPGYIKIRSKVSLSSLNLDKDVYRELKSFIDDDLYLNQENIRRWMEGILDKVAYRTSGNNRCINLNGRYKITMKKSGPAFTLSMPSSKGAQIDIDLVPVLAFSINNPPPGITRKLPCTNDNPQFNSKCWFAVPKPLDNNRSKIPDHPRRYWRLCFYELEKSILSEKKYERAKLIIRHLKKLRDTLNLKNIASYYIETLCLHHVDIIANPQKLSHTHAFFMMFKKFHDAFYHRRINCYWDSKLNLLEKIGQIEMTCIEHQLYNIINKIERNIKNNKFAIAEVILSKDECDKLKSVINANGINASTNSNPNQNQPSNKEWCVII